MIVASTIVPDRSVARTLADMTAGRAGPDLSTIMRGEIRFFVFVAREEDAGALADIELPKRTRPVCIYRGDEVVLPDGETKVRKDDDVVLITHSEEIATLTERWGER